MKLIKIIKFLILIFVILNSFILSCEGDSQNIKKIVDLITRFAITILISRIFFISLEPYFPKNPVLRKDLNPEQQKKRDEEINETIQALIKEAEEAEDIE